MYQSVLVSVTDDHLHSDEALTDRSEDELGYDEFITDLADLIKRDIPRNGFVVSINGSWGSGKSTVLNFLESELEDSGDKDSDGSPTVIRFNPWWFSGEADLIQRYLEELAAELDEAGQYDELRETVAKYANAVSKVPLDAAGFPVNKAVDSAADLMEPREKTTTELKSSIETTIKSEYDHIVVLIDEIDRLTNQEVSQVFKLVKSVADFPNTTYVLAFSNEIVTDALEADENPHRVEDGVKYLNKIVQLPRRVPVPKRGSLRMMLEKGLQQISSNDTKPDSNRRFNIINDICKLVDTPRDVNRLLNSVQSSHVVLDENVNFLDVVALEALKENAKPVYETVLREPESFSFLFRNKTTLHILETEDALDKSMSVPVENLLSAVFPHWEEETFRMSDEMEFDYRQSNRVAHPDRLHRYLRKTVPKNQYDSAEITKIIQSADEEQFVSRLRDKLPSSNSDPTTNRVFLSELVALRDKIREPKVILNGIFTVADELIRLDNRAYAAFETNTTTYILYLYRFVANNLSTTPTKKIKTAIRNGESLYFPQHLANKEVDENANLDIQYCQHTPELQNISPILSDLAESKRENKELVQVPYLWNVLELLENNTYFVSDWLGNVATDRTRLASLLVGFTRTGRRNGQPIYYIDTTELREHVDLGLMQNTVSSLIVSNFNEREQRAIKNFQTAMRLIEDNVNPGDMANWDIVE